MERVVSGLPAEKDHDAKAFERMRKTLAEK